MIFIMFVLNTFKLNDIVCHRKQFSLKFIFVIIVHKSQNLTFSKIVIFLSRKNVDFTNAYVVLLKIRNYNDFAIEESFFHNVFFKIIPSKIIIQLTRKFVTLYMKNINYIRYAFEKFKIVNF